MQHRALRARRLGTLWLAAAAIGGLARAAFPAPCTEVTRVADARAARAHDACTQRDAEAAASCHLLADARREARVRRKGCVAVTSAATFTGRLDGGDALVAVVSDGGRVVAWVCGDRRSYAALSGGFSGLLDRGLFDLKATIGPNARRLVGVRTAEGFSGRLVLADGSERRWSATRVTSADAGLFMHRDARGVTAVVQTSDGEAAGVSTIGGTIAPVDLTGRPRAGGSQRVSVAVGTALSRLLLTVNLIGRPGVVLPPATGPDVPPAPSIQVKFAEGTRVRIVDGEPVDLDGLALQDPVSRQLLEDLERVDAEWKPMHAVPEERLTEMRNRAVASLGHEVADLNLYAVLRFPRVLDPVHVLARLNLLPDVEFADFMPHGELPDVPDMTDSANESGAFQRYLDDAVAGGIDAFYAWQFTTGAGVRIADVEGDFADRHHDLPGVQILGSKPQPEDPDDRQKVDRRHGTAVLGIMGSTDDGQGTTGIAPDASLLFSSIYTDIYNIGSAISRAADALSPGDIIVVEQQIWGPTCPRTQGCGLDGDQSGLVAAEFDKGIYDAIVTAVGNGITVVEAAGNGGMDYDSDVFYRTRPFVPGHNPFDGSIDSGAIIVGAGQPGGDDDRQPLSFTNYGSRVDLQGWGSGVATTTSNHLADDEICDDDLSFHCFEPRFSGTSSATPIVAGAATLLQSFNLDRNGEALAPLPLRSLLVDSGMPQPPADGGSFRKIGPRPNLRIALDVLRGELPPPIITPAPDRTYDAPIEVRMAFGPGLDNDTAIILYTLDGHEPSFEDPDSFEYVPDDDAYLFFRFPVTVKAQTFLRTVIDPATGKHAASRRIIAPFYIADPRIGEVSFSLPNGTYPTPQTLHLDHPDASAIIWYTASETEIPDYAYTPEMLVAPSLIFFRDINLGPSLAPVVTVKARAYVTRSDGMIAPGPVTTRTYELTTTP